MRVFHFPLLAWSVEDGVVGVLVGTPFEAAAPDVRRLRGQLETRARRALEAEEGPLFPISPLENSRLRIREVPFRPSFREVDGFFPASGSVTVPVAAVHGENDFGSFTCHLPLLGQRFIYYAASQLDVLIEHFARNLFRDMTPPEIHRFLAAPEPVFQEVTVRAKAAEEKPWAWKPRDPVFLPTVADRYPRSRQVRLRLHAMPEAAWERGADVDRVLETLREGGNPLLVGDPGVGKTSILLEAIKKFHVQGGGGRADRHAREEGEAGGAKRRAWFWKTTPQRLIAGARYLGEWQEVCERALHELEDPGHFLWMDAFADLAAVGGSGPEDSVGAYLVPALDRGLRMVGEATPREVEALRILLPGLVDRFRLLRVDEMGKEQTLKVLDQFATHSSRNLGVEFDREALEEAYRLLGRFQKYEKFPGKAVRFLGSCVGEAGLEDRARVERGHATRAFIERTGIPEQILRDDLPLDEAAMRRFFSGRILGQEEAVRRVLSVVRVLKTGLNDPGKPVATLLFAGPTGVGKTALARALSSFLYGAGARGESLLRLDMSEFRDESQIGRLIGSGGGAPGELVRRLRERPCSVVLFDEIEKAHPEFFDALLAVLDEGILADALGRVTDFRNAVLILTTNLGTRRGSSLGFGADAPPSYEAEVRAFFRPEFFNRLDGVVTFHPLDAATIRGIARKELREAGAREGLAKRKIRLAFTEALERLVVEAGFDPVYGARPLQRAVERLVVGALARFLLEHRDLSKCTLLADAEGGAVRVEIAPER
jgi:ATP-dependent Clp protease ATP-binding subunit ClpC